MALIGTTVGELGCGCNCVYNVFLKLCLALGSCTGFKVPVTHLKASHTGAGPGKQADLFLWRGFYCLFG